MADAESIPQLAQSRAPFSTWLGVVLLFALFGAIVLAIIGPSPRGDSYEQKRAKVREEKLKAAREEDAKALTSYVWIDKNKGVARIPIDRAMELTVAELAQKKPAAAGPIATPEQPTVAATGAATPAAAPAASPSPTGTPKPTSVAGPSSETHNQPAGAVNPAQPSPAKAPQQTPVQSPPGMPVPVRGKETPAPTP